MYTYFHNQNVPQNAPQGTNVWRTYKEVADFIAAQNLVDTSIYVVHADWGDHTAEISPQVSYLRLICESPISQYEYKGFSIRNDTERYIHVVSGSCIFLYAKWRVSLDSGPSFVMVYDEDENALYVDRRFATVYKGTVTATKNQWQVPKTTQIKLEDPAFFNQYKFSR